jgi:hypothetical protein
VSRATRERLAGAFELEPAGPIDLKGFGIEEAWFVRALADGCGAAVRQEAPAISHQGEIP